MKITIGPISLDLLLFFRLWLPATLFIGLCTGIFAAFIEFLQLLDQIAPSFMRNGWDLLLIWLLLLIFYIILGVAFTRFFAHLFRRSFGLEELHLKRGMAILSGAPFYVLCSLFFMLCLAGILYPEDCAAPVFISLVGFVGLGLFSCGYLLLLRFFLRRSPAIAHQ